MVRRRLPGDWTERYNTTPVLIETFVETPRYTGAVYRASGWNVEGRGRYDREKLYDPLPIVISTGAARGTVGGREW